MADSPRVDDGKGVPKSSPDPTAEPPDRDYRLFPGGRIDAPAIGVNAVDRDDLPSHGLPLTLDYRESPEDEKP